MHLYIYYDRRAESWKGCTLGSEALDSSREVNEARGGLMLAAGRVRPKKKKTKKNTEKSAPPPKKHATKSTAALRPNPTRDGMRGNTSHALAHTLPLP